MFKFKIKNSLKIKNLKFIIVIIVLASTIMMALPAHAADPLVICGRKSLGQPECTTCDIVSMFKNVVDFVTLTLTPIIAFLLIVLSGAIIVLGGAAPEMVSKGKKMLTNTVIALIIIYGSFMIVTFILKTLAGDSNISTEWYKIQCDNSIGGGTTPTPTGLLPISSASPGTGGPGGPNARTPYGSNTPSGFHNDVSTPIANLRTCIESNLSRSFATVTSTTDSNIAAGKCDPLDPNERFNDKSNNCSHAKNSCHYGGTEPACQQYGSYALDYVSTDPSISNQAIQDVVYKCDPKAVTFVESVGTNNEHVHISIGKEYGCGCDD